MPPRHSDRCQTSFYPFYLNRVVHQLTPSVEVTMRQSISLSFIGTRTSLYNICSDPASNSCSFSNIRWDDWDKQWLLRDASLLAASATLGLKIWGCLTFPISPLSPFVLRRLEVKKLVLIFNVKKIMLNFEHFWKCTPEMYPRARTPLFRFLNKATATFPFPSFIFSYFLQAKTLPAL